MSLPFRSASLFAAAFVLSCAAPVSGPPATSATPASVAAPAPSAASPAASSAARPMYRLDYVLTTTDVGKPAVPTAHSLSLEENNVGEVRVGQNVPLQVGAGGGGSGGARPFVARQDIGLRIRAHIKGSGDGLSLSSDLEQSWVDDQGAIHKVSLKGDAPVVVGTSVPVSTTEDPTSHRKHQLSVTLTRVR